MAIVSAPYTITGTLGDLIFYVDQDNVNRVKTKGNPGITKEQFKTNPIFDPIKKHGKEFGQAAKKSRIFRFLANRFFMRAKDVSTAGRANKLLFEVLEEDTANERGMRTVENGLNTKEGVNLLVGYEGNRSRPLYKTLKKRGEWNPKTETFHLPNLSIIDDIEWPENASKVHLAVAQSNWDYINDTFETAYSEEVVYDKEDKTIDITLKPEKLKGDKLVLLFVFIGFSENYKKKIRPLKRSFNSVIIQQILKHNPI
ncbi:hypothetical protein [Flavobacterium sp.]|uniref:hypothetical protein n=1 Tax=Flavobacterium sp. TaxID=239 RepID=UPI00352833C5